MSRRFVRRGFTLVELLVVIAIIGVLVALLLPAIQAAREAARRTQCNNNLKNIGLGLQNYHDTYKTFPMGAMHTGLRIAPCLGPSWQYGILPFMEQRNIYDKIANTIRAGYTNGSVGTATAGTWPFAANNLNACILPLGIRPLDRLIPDYMRCPSSPLPVMVNQTGSICLSTYTGIAGGTDILRTSDANYGTLYPNPNLWGTPGSTLRAYINRAGVTATMAAGGVVACTPAVATGAVITNSGMLPIAQQVGMQGCTDGTSNTMIVGEQSDWLRDVNRQISTKYHGDSGWNGVGGPGTNVGTDQMGGFLSGTLCVAQINDQPWTATTVAGPPVWPTNPIIFNVTTVHYKPQLKECIGSTVGSSTSAPGCCEIMGINNPLQAAHPGGLLVAFVERLGAVPRRYDGLGCAAEDCHQGRWPDGEDGVSRRPLDVLNKVRSRWTDPAGLKCLAPA